MNIEERTFEFALQIIKICKSLNKEHEYILSKQLLRSGTSIGANIAESQAAQSKKDFISKMSIASKEARETFYRLRPLDKAGYLTTPDKNFIFTETNNIINIITKIIITTQKNLANAK